MDGAESRPMRRGERETPIERKAPPPPRQRGEGGGGPGGGQRSPQEPRRKRTNEQRYAGWGDGLDRAFCLRAETLLPSIFPVESHGGAATIPQIVVARRESALLLCTFSHCGAHVWPDGEIVEERAVDAAPEGDEAGEKEAE